MASIFEKISDFFDVDEEETESQKTISNEIEGGNEKKIELMTVINFVRELEAYYTNDIFKIRSSYMSEISNEDRIIYLKRKIQDYETSVKEITCIKEELMKKERSCRELWGKTSYSFYEELEEAKLSEVFKEAFDIVKQLIAVNSIPELEEIIRNRLRQYQESWNLYEVNIPENTNLQITGVNSGIETYKFGKYKKEVIAVKEKELSPEKILAIKKMKINYQFKSESDMVWIRCCAVTRKKLDFIQKSVHFVNDWENNASQKFLYDIVPKEDVETYVRAMTQLLLPRKDFVIITMINPCQEFIEQVGKMLKINETGGTVEIVDSMNFLQEERSGYNENLKFCCISSRCSLKDILFYNFKLL